MDRISHSEDRCIPARMCAWTPRVDRGQPCTWCCNDKQCSARPAPPPHHSHEPSGFPPHLRGLAFYSSQTGLHQLLFVITTEMDVVSIFAWTDSAT